MLQKIFSSNFYPATLWQFIRLPLNNFVAKFSGENKLDTCTICKFNDTFNEIKKNYFMEMVAPYSTL
jgi:hypothetical protein